MILIQASNVVLDLNGFNVRCSFTPASGFGLAACITDNFATSYSGLTFRNGSITAVGNAATFNIGQSVTGLLLRSGAVLVEQIHFSSADSTGYSISGMSAGPYSIIPNNTFSDGASPSLGCPSVIDSNTNQTLGAGASGSGCKYVNNVGLFPTA